MVENIEKFKPQFHFGFFSNFGVLVYPKIGVIDAWAVEEVAPCVAEDSRRFRRETIGVKVIVVLRAQAENIVGVGGGPRIGLFYRTEHVRAVRAAVESD